MPFFARFPFYRLLSRSWWMLFSANLLSFLALVSSASRTFFRSSVVRSKDGPPSDSGVLGTNFGFLGGITLAPESTSLLSAIDKVSSIRFLSIVSGCCEFSKSSSSILFQTPSLHLLGHKLVPSPPCCF